MDRSRHNPALALGVAWAVAAAMLTLATASAWHHHDHADVEHEGCSVCLGVHQPRAEAPARPSVAPASVPVALVDDACPACPGFVGAPRVLARGPPRA